MTPFDWTQPPTVETPANLGSILGDARMEAMESDRSERTVRLRFALAEGSGIDRTTFEVLDATHLLAFAYLPPVAPLAEGLSPEEAMARVGEWARQGTIVSADPFAFDTTLVVRRAFLHANGSVATLSVEGHGEDAERLVWWEIRVSGASIEALGP